VTVATSNATREMTRGLEGDGVNATAPIEPRIMPPLPNGEASQ
jgi:hypothetical protein